MGTSIRCLHTASGWWLRRLVGSQHGSQNQLTTINPSNHLPRSEKWLNRNHRNNNHQAKNLRSSFPNSSSLDLDLVFKCNWRRKLNWIQIMRMGTPHLNMQGAKCWSKIRFFILNCLKSRLALAGESNKWPLRLHLKLQKQKEINQRNEFQRIRPISFLLLSL